MKPLFLILLFISAPLWAQSVDQAMRVYDTRQTEYSQAQQDLLAARQRITEGRAALRNAQTAVENARRKRDEKRDVFRAAQELEARDPYYSSTREKKAYLDTVETLKQAGEKLRTTQAALTEADKDARKLRDAAQHAAEQVNIAAGQVAEARLQKLRAELGVTRNVEVEHTRGCSDLIQSQCPPTAIEEALEEAARRGAAVHVQALSVTRLVSGARPELEETIKTAVSGTVASYEVVEAHFTRAGNRYVKIRARVQGQVPAALKKGLSPPLADGDFPEMPELVIEGLVYGDAFIEPKSGIKFIKIPYQGKYFWLAETEVTQAQWCRVMDGNPSHFEGDERPVEGVDWHQAVEFTTRLGKGYRLPTEQEWEHAARAGSSGAYSLNARGEEVTESDLDEYAWYNEDYPGNGHHPVGKKKPNKFGLYDMHGNVWEWTCSAWDSGGNGKEGCVSKNHAKKEAVRVIRGGSWDLNAGRVRASARLNWRPGYRINYLGFRPARIY